MTYIRQTIAGFFLIIGSYAWGALPTDAVSYITAGEPLFVATRTLEKTLGTKIEVRDINPDKQVTGRYVAPNGLAFVEEFARRNQFAWVYRDNRVILAPLGTDLSASPKATTGTPAPQSFSRIVYDPKDANKYGLMVFQVQNASVDDRRVANNRVTPGVARLFSQFIGVPFVPNPSTSGNTGNASQPAVVPPVPESAKVQNSILGLFTKNAPNTPSSSESGIANADRGVYADSRLNAVLVRDKISNFESYKQIIALLDRPADMVQLEAHIVDIKKSQIESLGINFGIGRGEGSLILSSFSRRSLLNRIQLLEASDEAESLSVPSVVSLNNEQALFSSRENFFISVNSNAPGSVGSVNQITAETQLLVTPIIANESADIPFNERRVKLLINVQDAQANATSSTVSASGVTTNTLPTTTENQITTQAVVRSGDTLVIGGQVVRKKSKKSEGLPTLGKLPLFGALFAQKDEGFHDYVRIYIVRPQILGEDSKTANEITQNSSASEMAKKVVK